MDSGGIKIISDSDPPGIFPENVIAEPYVAELYQWRAVQKSYCTGAVIICNRVVVEIQVSGVLREENRYSPINGCIYSGPVIVHDDVITDRNHITQKPVTALLS